MEINDSVGAGLKPDPTKISVNSFSFMAKIITAKMEKINE
jgi:hypothetical protein